MFEWKDEYFLESCDTKNAILIIDFNDPDKVVIVKNRGGPTGEFINSKTNYFYMKVGNGPTKIQILPHKSEISCNKFVAKDIVSCGKNIGRVEKVIYNEMNKKWQYKINNLYYYEDSLEKASKTKDVTPFFPIGIKIRFFEETDVYRITNLYWGYSKFMSSEDWIYTIVLDNVSNRWEHFYGNSKKHEEDFLISNVEVIESEE